MSGTETTAEAYLRRLAERGVEHVFANAGTDFAPLVEALSKPGRAKYPRFVTVPHENVAMGMAHGYHRVGGKPAVVMVHVTVGTANAMCGLMNAARDGVPLMLAAGRTPVTETGHIASRNGHIHWGQEAFDQGGMVREYVKWDYELRAGQPVEAVVDRALDIAMSEPRGPVYLTLPREVLADPAVPARREEARPLGAVAAHPAPQAIEETARLIARAEFPLIVTSNAGRTGFAALSRLAERHAIPVLQSTPTDLNLPTDHPMHVGYEAAAVLPRADVVVVVDSAVPWMPKAAVPRRDATVIHIGADPLVSRFPFRACEADRLIAGNSAAALAALDAALDEVTKEQGAAIDRRRAAIAELRAAQRARRRDVIEKAKSVTPIMSPWLSACVDAVKPKDAIVVNELGLQIGHLGFGEPGSYLGGNMSGGLGFGLGAALGAKLAAPERDVIVAVGDGSYMFGNPLPYHFVGQAEKLPTLTIVANNHSWHAVRNATLQVYPDGAAAAANVMPLTQLTPEPRYEKAIEICGGYGERVERPEDLQAALRRGLDAVRAGTPALINVLTQGRH